MVLPDAISSEIALVHAPPPTNNDGYSTWNCLPNETVSIKNTIFEQDQSDNLAHCMVLEKVKDKQHNHQIYASINYSCNIKGVDTII